MLDQVKKSLQERYPNSDISIDGQVIIFKLSGYLIEIVPCFVEDEKSFKFADTSNGGSWEVTKPKLKIDEISQYHKVTGHVLRKLCKMTLSWKNKCNVQIGGFLIDTLCYNFLKQNPIHHKIGFSEYDILFLSFFEFLKNLDRDQQYWLAPGSNQRVYKKDSFTGKAKKLIRMLREQSIEMVKNLLGSTGK